MSFPVKSHLNVLLIADSELHTGRVVTNWDNLASENRQSHSFDIRQLLGAAHLVCVTLLALLCYEVDVYLPGNQTSSILILYLQLQYCYLGERMINTEMRMQN